MTKKSPSKVSKPVSLVNMRNNLKKDRNLRKNTIKFLAREYPNEFLGLVKVDNKKLKNLSTSYIVSEKEWQE